jgi:hypothetical protein
MKYTNTVKISIVSGLCTNKMLEDTKAAHNQKRKEKSEKKIPPR